jgi:hypothetical protein
MPRPRLTRAPRDHAARRARVLVHAFVAPPAGHVDGPDVCLECGWHREDPSQHPQLAHPGAVPLPLFDVEVRA